jgi:hypothetical protein
MIGFENDSIRSSALSKLRPGTVELHVPLVDNVIQVHSLPEETKVVLILEIDASGVHVRREDNAAIQIAVAMETGVDTYTGTPIRDIYEIFKAPVDGFSFTRAPAKGFWTPTGKNVETLQKPTVEEFARTLGGFAVAKQRNNESVFRRLFHN